MIPIEDRTKFILTILILAFVGWWAYFTVCTVKEALVNLTAIDVMQAAGATGLLGSLITLLTLSWQYWFRRAKPDAK